MLSLLKI